MMDVVVIRLRIISNLSPNLEESVICDHQVRLITILQLSHCDEL
jgi:hypothetical protein